MASLVVRSLMYSFSEYLKKMTYDVITDPPTRVTHVLSSQREATSRYVVRNIIGTSLYFAKHHITLGS